jgi:regulator of cell morphogenesis and NO signaling
MTTTIDPTTTLGDLVTAHPRLARELERRGLDYCCGGRKTLDEASRAAGLDPGTVAGELAAATVEEDPAPWATMGVTDLVDHIVDVHHRFLWDELPRAEALAEKIAGVHGGRHPELAEVHRLTSELRADLEQHLLKEEQVLFPRIHELATTGATSFHCGSLATPISVMLVEHDRAGDLLASLRAVTGGYAVPSDGCASYQACYDSLAQIEADTHLHVHKENNLLFPAVVRLEDQAGG